MDFPVYRCIIDENTDSDLQVEYVSLVSKPAIMKDFLFFKKEECKFSIDASRRIISGPAMIADMLIYRNVEPIGEYYTYFDKDTIQQIALKFFKKGYMQNFNIMHDEKQTTSGITIFESFITDVARGIAAPKGFEDVADGSWFISAKVDDEDIWKKISTGEVKGYSVEGIFKQIPVKQPQKLTPEEALSKLGQLLNLVDFESLGTEE